MILILFGILFLFPSFLIHASFSRLVYSLGAILLLISLLLIIEEFEIVKTKKKYRFFSYFSYYSYTIYLAHNPLYFLFYHQLNAFRLLFFFSVATILIVMLLRVAYNSKWRTIFSLKIQLGRLATGMAKKIEEKKKYRCPHCKSQHLTKRYSRFSSPQSDETRMEKLADPSKWRGLDENDPKSMMKFIKKMGKEFGDELGEDYDKMIEEAEEEVLKRPDSQNSDKDLYTPGELSD